MSAPGPRIVLASASPRRRELLEFLRIPVEVIPSEIDEESVSASSPRALAMKLACMKAESVAESLGGGACVIASDTVVALGDEVFNKPSDAQDARRMLNALRGRTHRVITAVAVALSEGGVEVDARATEVTMRRFTDRERDAYVETGEPLDKAGAYGFQGGGGDLVERLEGCHCNVVGLPLICTLRLLRDTLDLGEHPVPCRCEMWPHLEARPLPWEK